MDMDFSRDATRVALCSFLEQGLVVADAPRGNFVPERRRYKDENSSVLPRCYPGT
jgi:hypothetical protein